MNYSITPFVFIILSLIVVVVVIIRKFPQLSLLDVDSLPEVKEGKKKDEIFKKKAAKKAAVSGEKRKSRVQPWVQKWKELQLRFRKYVGNVERSVIKNLEEKSNNKPVKDNEKKEDKISFILKDAHQIFENGEYDLAEKKYIEAIRIDSKNKEAYFGLAEVYLKQNNLDEAKETFEFLLQFDENNDKVLLMLAEIFEQKGDVKSAVDYYEKSLLVEDSDPKRFVKIAELLQSIGQNETALEAWKQAVELEPQNPKYLDNLIESAIIVGIKKLAEETYQKLRMVNPENQKLASLKERVDEMPT